LLNFPEGYTRRCTGCKLSEGIDAGSGGQLVHALRLNFRQRFSIFIVSGDYAFQKMWSDTLSNATELAADNYNLRGEWSRANRTPVHTWNTNVNARLPLGVFLTGTMSANTGRPYTITTGRDDNMDGFATDRPPGTPRHSGDGQKFLGFNFNISKAFFFSDVGTSGTRTNLNVFANMTNAFNRANYGQPSSVMTSPNFGRSTSALDPREIEVGMRFQF